MIHTTSISQGPSLKMTKWLSFFLSHKWTVSLLFAAGTHLAVWYLPFAMPSNKVEKPREIRLVLQKVRPQPKPKKRVVPKPRPRKKVRRRKVRRRRVRRRVRKRRVVKRPRPIPKRVVTPKPAPRRPEPVIPPKAVAKVTPRRIVPPQPPPRQVVAKRIDFRAYGRSLYRSVIRQKRYPRMAVRMGYEGTVILLIQVAPSGKLYGKPRVVRSSGHSMLDEEAIRMIKAAAPWPSMPKGFSRAYKTFRLPVRFSLRR